MRLGEWIDTLEQLPGELPVVMDFMIRSDGAAVPTRLMSWRGHYSQLTLNSRASGGLTTVNALLEDARRAVGGTFEGYKGGKFVMDAHTPVWADEWGVVDHRMIVAARQVAGQVVVRTRLIPEEYVL